MKIQSFAAGLFFSCLSAINLWAEVPSSGGTAESLAAAEVAFAHEAAEKGTRTAFLNALSDDGIVFDQGPTNGKKAWEAKKESPAVLRWQPVLAATSAGGDLGYTTGPWNYRKTPNESPGTFGDFVSIWRWEAGKWKLIFDLGVEHPAPKGPPSKLVTIVSHAPNQSAADAFAVMEAHDRKYMSDRAANLDATAAENVRFYRPNQYPTTNKAAAAALLRKDPKLNFSPAHGQVSRGGDLGYLWGEYRTDENAGPAGDYLRIWRKVRTGEWKLALDLMRPR